MRRRRDSMQKEILKNEKEMRRKGRNDEKEKKK